MHLLNNKCLLKLQEDIREIVTESIESERRAPDWNPENDRYFKGSEARLGLTLKVGATGIL